MSNSRASDTPMPVIANGPDRALEAAISRNAIGIVFQPQVDPLSGQVIGAEALARWSGEPDTATLFDRARTAGLGERLSRHAQRKAIAMAACWTGPLADLGLSINIAAEEIGRDSYVDWLVHEIEAHRFDPHRLTVELTESRSLADPRAASTRLEALRSIGVRVALDDLGTGYANLAYLTQLPLDGVKIDRGLVAGMDSEKGRILVHALIGMARKLGYAIVVEGVETLAQHALVSDWGFDLVQGFLAAGPLDEAELARFVAVRRRAAA